MTRWPPGRRTLTVGLGLALAVGLAWDGAAARRSRDPGAELLATARARMAQDGFTGEVVVEWRDSGGVHSATVTVLGADGAVEVAAERRFVSNADGSFVAADDGWITLRSRDALAVVPEPDDKYELVVEPGPNVAGRPTTVVEAVLPTSGLVIERMFIDDDTGFLLRRERLDEAGDLVRRVSFVEISIDGPGSTDGPVDPAASVVRSESSGRFGGAYRDPDRAGDGFELVARTRHESGLAQLTYSDGLLTVSVFEEPGRLDLDRLPPDGTAVEVDGVVGVRYDLAIGAAYVWERDGMVYTAVSDAPVDQTLGVAASVSAPRRDDPIARLARNLLAPFEL